MVGEPKYVPAEIYWILEQVLAKVKPEPMSRGYMQKFGKDLTPTQIRYVKNKYGKDPDYNSPLINKTLMWRGLNWSGRHGYSKPPPGIVVGSMPPELTMDNHPTQSHEQSVSAHNANNPLRTVHQAVTSSETLPSPGIPTKASQVSVRTPRQAQPTKRSAQSVVTPSGNSSASMYPNDEILVSHIVSTDHQEQAPDHEPFASATGRSQMVRSVPPIKTTKRPRPDDNDLQAHSHIAKRTSLSTRQFDHDLTPQSRHGDEMARLFQQSTERFGAPNNNRSTQMTPTTIRAEVPDTPVPHNGAVGHHFSPYGASIQNYYHPSNTTRRVQPSQSYQSPVTHMHITSYNSPTYDATPSSSHWPLHNHEVLVDPGLCGLSPSMAPEEHEHAFQSNAAMYGNMPYLATPVQASYIGGYENHDTWRPKSAGRHPASRTFSEQAAFTAEQRQTGKIAEVCALQNQFPGLAPTVSSLECTSSVYGNQSTAKVRAVSLKSQVSASIYTEDSTPLGSFLESVVEAWQPPTDCSANENLLTIDPSLLINNNNNETVAAESHDHEARPDEAWDDPSVGETGKYPILNPAQTHASRERAVKADIDTASLSQQRASLLYEAVTYPTFMPEIKLPRLTGQMPANTPTVEELYRRPTPSMSTSPVAFDGKLPELSATRASKDLDSGGEIGLMPITYPPVATLHQETPASDINRQTRQQEWPKVGHGSPLRVQNTPMLAGNGVELGEGTTPGTVPARPAPGHAVSLNSIATSIPATAQEDMPGRLSPPAQASTPQDLLGAGSSGQADTATPLFCPNEFAGVDNDWEEVMGMLGPIEAFNAGFLDSIRDVDGAEDSKR